MKHIIEFDLTEHPDDREALEDMMKAKSYCIALFDMSQEFRKELKYNEKLKGKAYKKVSELSDRFYEILADNNIEL